MPLSVTLVILISLFLVLPTSLWNLLQFLYVQSSKRSWTTMNLRSEAKGTVSVIVAVKGENPKLLQGLLEDMKAQTYSDFEVLIVSDDDEPIFTELQSLVERYPFAKVIRGKGVGLKAGALNVGIERSKGDLLLFLDAEARVEGDFLERVSSIQGDALAFRLKIRKTFHSEIEDTYAVMTEHSMDSLFKGRSRLGLPIFPNGSAFMVRKEVIEKLNGFREGSLAEDLEIGVRLFLAGVKIEYVDDVIVYTISPPDEKSLFNQLSRWAYGSSQLFALSLSMLRKGLKGAEGFLYVQQWGLYILPFFVLAADLLLTPFVGVLPFLVSLLTFTVMSLPLLVTNRKASPKYGIPFILGITKGYLKGLLGIYQEWRVTPKEKVVR